MSSVSAGARYRLPPRNFRGGNLKRAQLLTEDITAGILTEDITAGTLRKH